MSNKYPVVVLISGNGSNLQAIIDTSKNADCNYEVVAVIANNPEAYGLVRAKKAKIASHVINHRNFATRLDFDTAMIQCISRYKPSLVVLAGFMRILTPEFVQQYLGRLINIHPSLLPKYQGLDTHQRALDAGDETHGVSVHFVTEELDGGPVMMQSVIDISKRDTVESLEKRIHEREHLIYPLCVDWCCTNKILFKEQNIIFDDQELTEAIIYEDWLVMTGR